MGRLFWKFFFATLLAQLLAMLSVGGSLSLKEPQRNNDANSRFILASAATTLQHAGVAALQTVLNQTSPQHPLYVIDETGRDLLKRDVAPDWIKQAQQQATRPDQDHLARQILTADGKTYLLFQTHPKAMPHVPGLPPPRRSEWGSLIPIATALFASLLFAALFAWYFSTPIRQLRSAMHASASGNLQTDLSLRMGQRNDELADLGEEFDRMAQQLRTLMEGQRNLLHDVSHELRSPLARMQAALGLLRQNPDKLESSMNRIAHECEQMDKLIGELLDLSRLESGIKEATEESIRFETLIADLIESAQFEASCSDKDVVYHGDSAAIIKGQPELLYSALENVIRNALKYSPPESQIRIEAQCDPALGQLQLTVSDAGPGVAPDELEQIFTPFFRGSTARNRAVGYGLGLAIARRVIEAHKGSIKASLPEQGGLCIHICLPIQADCANTDQAGE